MNIIRKRKSYKTITSADISESFERCRNASTIIDHQSEWNGGYNPTSEGTGLILPRGISTPDSKPEQLKLEPQKTEEIKICCCSSRDLFHFGCRCGGK